jgi:hypothetical protein
MLQNFLTTVTKKLMMSYLVAMEVLHPRLCSTSTKINWNERKSYVSSLGIRIRPVVEFTFAVNFIVAKSSHFRSFSNEFTYFFGCVGHIICSHQMSTVQGVVVQVALSAIKSIFCKK